MRSIQTWAAAAAVAISLAGVPAAASAAFVTFVPPNDTTGALFNPNANDGYASGRGIVFTATADTVIDGVGLYQNLSNVQLAFRIDKVLTNTGVLSSGATTLASGSAQVNTGGVLSFIDFSFASLLLQAGGNYQISFSFAGPSPQNFYYTNDTVRFTTGNFSAVNGTLGDDARNGVLPAIRVNVVEPVSVPEPASAALFGAGLAGLVLVRRRRAA